MAGSTTHLDQITDTQDSIDTTVNALFSSASPAMLGARNDSSCSGLTWGYLGGYMWVDGVLTNVANGTLTLTASTTNYIELNRLGVISSNTTGFTVNRIPLYTATTATASVSSYVDYRVTNPLRHGRLSKSVAGGSNVTLTAAENRVESMNFTGLLTANINVIVANGPQRWCVTNNTTGAYTLTVKTSAGTGIAVTQGKAVLLESDATNVIMCETDYTAMGLGTAATATLDTDGTLAGNSDTRVASQKAVKTYVDTAVTGLLDFKGATDCSANPNYPAASKGDFYIVSVAGKIGGASGTTVDAGDSYYATADNAGGTEAGVGTSWAHVEHNVILGTIATQDANNVSITGGSITGITDLAVADGGTGAGTAQAAMANLKGVYILASSAVAVSCPADTTEDVLATITVPANAMGANGLVRITATWSCTNNANAKTLRIRFGGTGGTVCHNRAMASQATARFQTQINNRNSTSSQHVVNHDGGIAPSTNTSISPAADTTAAVDIVISGQKATSGDTLTLESYLVELIVP